MANRKKLTPELLKKHPICCFCGGGVAATTADHVPARIQFWRKRRPGGLELPACLSCNVGTRALEQVAALFSRMRVEELSPDEAAEVRQLSISTDLSFPGWRAELYPGVGQIAQTMRSLGEAANHIQTVDMSGPLVSDALSVLIAKLGFGLHYHHSRHIVPTGGVVEVRYETNASMIDRPLPTELFSFLGPVEHLRQGKWTSESHFGYRGAWMDDGRCSMFVGHIGKALGFIAIVFANEADDASGTTGFKLFRPGDLQRADALARARYPVAAP
ncbi:MAG: hypothetical protein QOJ15_3171 [Bradyrhizobium sp.]|jgi:hypothetical protein|nr:hypothetical protein [Bradyrhizobium sp.]